MRWEAHQRSGFIGLAPGAAVEQPRLLLEKYGVQKVDVDEALDSSSRALGLWLDARKQPDAPAYSGGVLDSWPAWAVDSLAICRDEEKWIELYVSSQARKEARRG